MSNRNNSNFGFIAGIIVTAVAVGTASAWFAHNYLRSSSSPTSSQPSAPVETKTPSPSPTATNPPVQPETPNPTSVTQKPPTSQNISIYWVNSRSTQKLELAAANLSVANKSDSKEVLAVAFQELLAGTVDPDYTTTIPTGTKLLALKTDKTGIHLNLSGEFITGGGSESMMGRLGQVIYTATALEPDGKVWIEVDGKPLEYLGGEGIEVSQPMTRTQFQENFGMSIPFGLVYQSFSIG
jgi:spore germination protein GerM